MAYQRDTDSTPPTSLSEPWRSNIDPIIIAKFVSKCSYLRVRQGYAGLDFPSPPEVFAPFSPALAQAGGKETACTGSPTLRTHPNPPAALGEGEH